MIASAASKTRRSLGERTLDMNSEQIDECVHSCDTTVAVLVTISRRAKLSAIVSVEYGRTFSSLLLLSPEHTKNHFQAHPGVIAALSGQRNNAGDSSAKIIAKGQPRVQPSYNACSLPHQRRRLTTGPP